MSHAVCSMGFLECLDLFEGFGVWECVINKAQINSLYIDSLFHFLQYCRRISFFLSPFTNQRLGGSFFFHSILLQVRLKLNSPPLNFILKWFWTLQQKTHLQTSSPEWVYDVGPSFFYKALIGWVRTIRSNTSCSILIKLNKDLCVIKTDRFESY